MRTLIDLAGTTWGEWRIISRAVNSPCNHTMWSCECSCGTIKDVSGYKLTHGDSLSCGCVHPNQRLRPYEALYNKLCRGAKKRNLPCSLTYPEFVSFTDVEQCHYCGVVVAWSPFFGKDNSSAYKLDRKNNAQGYESENLVVACFRCNRTKHNRFTYAQMVEIGNLIRRWEGREVSGAVLVTPYSGDSILCQA